MLIAIKPDSENSAAHRRHTARNARHSESGSTLVHFDYSFLIVGILVIIHQNIFKNSSKNEVSINFNL